MNTYEWGLCGYKPYHFSCNRRQHTLVMRSSATCAAFYPAVINVNSNLWIQIDKRTDCSSNVIAVSSGMRCPAGAIWLTTPVNRFIFTAWMARDINIYMTTLKRCAPDNCEKQHRPYQRCRTDSISRASSWMGHCPTKTRS